MKRHVQYLPHSGMSAPAAPTETAESIGYFRGADFGHSPMTADMSRACDALNMLRDVPGQVRKRMGWHTVRQYDGRINGAYIFGGQTLIHAGTALYCGNEKIGELADAFSSAQVLGGYLWILDGVCLRRVEKKEDGFTLTDAAESAYVPTVIVSRSPDGGGTVNEEYNLLGRGFINSFYGQSGVCTYSLTDCGLDDDAVRAQVLRSDGTWEDRSEGADFSVDRTTGTVTFAAAPGVSPKQGEDNVRITACKTRAGYKEKIGRCTLSVLYGVNGAADRLFVGGNPDCPGQDFYSAQNNAAMFGDLSYSVLGQAAITGYSVVSDRLAAHKSGANDGRSVVLRYGRLSDEGRAVFPIVGALQGEASVAPRSHADIAGEPLFLTRGGVYALTASDITGERISRCRSGYVNPRLLAEDALEAACACAYEGFYLLAVNGHVYALDSLQKSYGGGEPYSSHRYEGYYLDSIPARVLWVRDNTLCFGTADGKVAEFYRDKNALSSYNDDGRAISAHWDTPYFCGKIRHTEKDFRYLSVTLAPHAATSLAVYAMKNGAWEEILRDSTGARYFDFGSLDFAHLSFSTDTSPRNIRRKIYVRGTDKIRLRLENSEKNEPFGIYDLTLCYAEGGKH